ncbi:hypothetical protein BWQ96_06296 [Gracilariopsis chorda]|uniref:Chitin-binding type-4 domain-containing protein n=1 Tax=Gracilariopsis chorda TaxID=448386 RepID=A0A2V3IPE7_9FLOR|nr:hypothetical protein BWQ96_06296 [Gracilariopsis chorda]|eukprot:PXF43927.1 hypothetical protein BWQ96_06296 [Gracilariopsis chorda]
MTPAPTLLRLLLALLPLLTAAVHAHAVLTDPPQRGVLNPANKFNRGSERWTNAPMDLKAHFPAGDKNDAPGAAARSQLRASANNWVPFDPLNPNFRWRAGVCGDPKRGEQQHMRGGRFYFGAQITRTYKQGELIPIEVNVVAHHNGFFQFHICDVAKCGGEISEQCFRDRHCYALKRAPNAACDSGFDKQCAPIDPNFPYRWYLPCATKPENSQERMGMDKMLWQLPDNLSCDHCVLQWFWSAANTCNPPGVIAFYDGPNRPRNWGNCFGQSGARGGVTRVQRNCSPRRNPEEYYQCADVRILSRQSAPPPANARQPRPVSAPTSVVSNGALQYVRLYADGREVVKLAAQNVVDVSAYSKLTFEAVAAQSLSSVHFDIDGTPLWTDWTAPYFMFGNRKRTPAYWKHPIFNRRFVLRVRAPQNGLQLQMSVTLVNKS